MDYILSDPVSSYSFRSWQNIATALNCLCVQQRTDDGVGKGRSFYNRYFRYYPCDYCVYRILYSTNPIDFFPTSQRWDGFDDGSERHVIAAANDFGDIMECYSMILSGWRVFFTKRFPPLGSEDVWGVRPTQKTAAEEEEMRPRAEAKTAASAYLPSTLRGAPNASSLSAIEDSCAADQVPLLPFSLHRWAMLRQYLQKKKGEVEEEEEEESGVESLSAGTHHTPSPANRTTLSRASPLASASFEGEGGRGVSETFFPPIVGSSLLPSASRPARETSWGEAAGGRNTPSPAPLLPQDPTPFPQETFIGPSPVVEVSAPSPAGRLPCRAAHGECGPSASCAVSDSGPFTSSAIRHRPSAEEGAGTDSPSPLLPHPSLASMERKRRVRVGFLLWCGLAILAFLAVAIGGRTAFGGFRKEWPDQPPPLSCAASRWHHEDVQGVGYLFSIQENDRELCAVPLSDGPTLATLRSCGPTLLSWCLPFFFLVFLVLLTYRGVVHVWGGNRGTHPTGNILRDACRAFSGVRPSHPARGAGWRPLGFSWSRASSAPQDPAAATRLSEAQQHGLRSAALSHALGLSVASPHRILREHVDVSPRLSEAEMHLLAQLQNYGAPYSSIVLRPLRGWNAKTESAGWSPIWRWEALYVSERPSPFSPTAWEVRASTNIPHTSIGTLQAVLLYPFYPEVHARREKRGGVAFRSPPPLERHGTAAFTSSPPPTPPPPSPASYANAPREMLFPNFLFPLCTEMEVVQKLEHNIFITRTVEHSRVLGVPPTAFYTYVSPAVMLDAAQQQELHLRRPFASPPLAAVSRREGEAGREGEKGASLGGGGYVYLFCAVHCPIDAIRDSLSSSFHDNPTVAMPRAVLHHQVWMGFEEPDGSLTLAVYRSVCLPSLDAPLAAAYRKTAYRSILHTMSRLSLVLQQLGPMPNELRGYRNHSLYIPFCHVPLSQEGIDSDASSSSSSSCSSLESPRFSSSSTRRRSNATPQSSPSPSRPSADASPSSSSSSSSAGGTAFPTGMATPPAGSQKIHKEHRRTASPRDRQPPPGIHWSSSMGYEDGDTPNALEPLSGLAGRTTQWMPGGGERDGRRASPSPGIPTPSLPSATPPKKGFPPFPLTLSRSMTHVWWTLPSPLSRFLHRLAQTNTTSHAWTLLSDQSEKGVKVYHGQSAASLPTGQTPSSPGWWWWWPSFSSSSSSSSGAASPQRPSLMGGKKWKQLKTEVYFPFQRLDAIELGIMTDLLFPSFGFERSRRQPIGKVVHPIPADKVGVIPMETVYKVHGAERVLSPRSVTQELVDGVHFTLRQLQFALSDAVWRQLSFLHSLSPDTCMFFYGGEGSDGDHATTFLSPLERSLCIQVPSYGFLCWKSSIVTDESENPRAAPRGREKSTSPSTRGSFAMGKRRGSGTEQKKDHHSNEGVIHTLDPSVSSAAEIDADSSGKLPSAPSFTSLDSPESTAGGVRMIAMVEYGSIRPFQWSSDKKFHIKQVEQVNRMVQAITDGCMQYSSRS